MLTEKQRKKGAVALKEYQEKIKSGEIERTPTKTPEEKAKANPKSLRLAINAKCWDCAAEQRSEVTKCHLVHCALHALRPWQPKNPLDEEIEEIEYLGDFDEIECLDDIDEIDEIEEVE